MANDFKNSGNNNQFFNGRSQVNIGSINNISNSSIPSDEDSAPEEGWKKEVYDLVTQVRLREALTLIAKSSPYHKQQVVQILSRLHRLEENTIAGTMTKNEEGIEHNNIVKAVILLTSTL